MKLRSLAFVPVLLLLTACGASEEASTGSAGTTESMSPDERYLNSIRSNGIDETGDIAVLELAEATCTASSMVDAGEDFAIEILKQSPRYLDSGTESTFVKVTLEEYCTDLPTQKTTTSPPASPPNGSNSIMDAAYLRVLESRNLGYLEDQQAIKIGKLACEGMDEGRSPGAIGAQIARDSGGIFTLNEGATFVGVAIASYCPEHKSLLGN
ncbi:DUF732 domain-containing protein [Rhodococcus sp. 2G]|uniref:DUF732 domain-containing protein n=1 Tax=Rhodococcus sp. 2G TaxID=1570939 RepID=UPI0018DB1281|nr:DUF732 domain-containing protein [Rhodococcus sp. 2G]